MQWYYSKNGAQLGPVDDAELRRLSLSGAITPEDFLWNETMGDTWQPASSLRDLFATASDIQPTTMSLTEGTTPNRELMGMARESLKGKWGIGVLAVLIYLGVLILTLIPELAIKIPYLMNAQQAQIQSVQAAHQANHSFKALPQPKIELPHSAILIEFIFKILQFLISAPLIVGLNLFFLNISRHADTKLSDIFGGFRIFWKSVGTYFLMGIFVLGWILLFCSPAIALLIWATITHQMANHQIVGGIITLAVIGYIFALIKMYSYSLAFFVLADKPTVGALQSIKMSTQMMRGKKWKLLCLCFRFFGWMLLAMLTCGIGYFFVMPYMLTAITHFYLDVKGCAALPDALATTSKPSIS